MDKQKEENYIKFMDEDTTHECSKKIKPIIDYYIDHRGEVFVSDYDIEEYLKKPIQKELRIQKYRIIGYDGYDSYDKYDIYFYHDNAKYYILANISMFKEKVEMNIKHLNGTTEEFEKMLDELQNK